jgi:hypothetical protein
MDLRDVMSIVRNRVIYELHGIVRALKKKRI